MKIEPRSTCRYCGGALEVKLDLGEVAQPGYFPRPGELTARGPLRLAECAGCHLAQLADTWDLGELYGPTYGYRSSLNASMLGHLTMLAAYARSAAKLEPGDLAVDIGSNDGSFLRLLDVPGGSFRLAGIDPLLAYLAPEARQYPAGTFLMPNFFTAARVRYTLGDASARARLVTSFAMFYDVPDPLAFAREVGELLEPGGLWLLEVADWPTLARAGAFDTICPEHLLYFSLSRLAGILIDARFELVDWWRTDTNGGSLVVAARTLPVGEHASHACGPWADDTLVDWARLGAGVNAAAGALWQLLERYRSRAWRVAGYGASTKGNVLLQVAGIDRTLLPVIGEVNPDKIGRVTPGTDIPIVAEAEARAGAAAFLVLPWHFRAGIIARERAFLERGGELIFPLPRLEIVRARDLPQTA